ncbi:hypothetical protein CGQ24_02195 [Arthrobacter sp. 7749]|nr:hypothetical protein CGQ24_02195 [Arthrobacter sp. 7749]
MKRASTRRIWVAQPRSQCSWSKPDKYKEPKVTLRHKTCSSNQEITGVTKPGRAPHDFPWQLGRVYLVQHVEGDLLEDEIAEIMSVSVRATGFRTDAIQLDSAKDKYKRGDIIFVHDNDYFYPPFLIDSAVIKTRADKSRMGQITQQKANKRPLRPSTISKRLKAEQISLDTLMQSLDDASDRLLLEGKTLEAMVKIWFPEFVAVPTD